MIEHKDETLPRKYQVLETWKSHKTKSCRYGVCLGTGVFDPESFTRSVVQEGTMSWCKIQMSGQGMAVLGGISVLPVCG